MWKINKLFSLSSQDCSRQLFIEFSLIGVFAFIVWKISLELGFQFIHKHTEMKLDIDSSSQLATPYSGNIPTNNPARSVTVLDMSVNILIYLNLPHSVSAPERGSPMCQLLVTGPLVTDTEAKGEHVMELKPNHRLSWITKTLSLTNPNQTVWSSPSGQLC